VTGGWRKLHDEELHDMFFSTSKIRIAEDDMGRACSTQGEKMSAYRILVGRPRGKRLL
jgi:predicted RNA-binding protein YlqC (UPF0109 family)